MKKKYLLLKLWTAIIAIGLFSSSTAFGQATLKHSYTFDGNANDAVGEAHGTAVGGTFSDTSYTAAANGEYIELPAATIAINTYSAITLEGFIFADVDNTGNNMMAYFGGNENGLGGNGLFMTPDRRGESRTAISCGNLDAPWSAEQGVTGDPVSVGNKHHVVTVLSATTIKWYINGELIGSTDISGDNSIANLSNSNAWLCKGGYDADPTWMGTLYEFNIYEGELTEAEIQEKFIYYMGNTYFDATLSAINTNTSTLNPVFDPLTDVYSILVDYGITSIILDPVPTVGGATVEMFDTKGEAIVDGVVNLESGAVRLEIIVTALNGSTVKKYSIAVDIDEGTKSANLSGIDLSAGYLIKDFHPDTLEYTAIVPYGTASVNVAGIKSWSGATVSGGGDITLTDGTGETTLSVTSEDGLTTKEYTLNLYTSKVTTGISYYFQHEASGYVIGESEEGTGFITLHHALKDESDQLFQLVDGEVSGQYYLKNELNNYITLSPDDVSDLVVSDVLTTDKDSCRFIVYEFTPGKFRIESVIKSASDGKYMGTSSSSVGAGIFSDKEIDNKQAIWEINLPEDVVDPYDTYLSEITVDVDSLSPNFSMFEQEYHIVLPIGTTSANVSAVTRDATSSVTGTGTIDVSDGKGTITLTVIGQDTSYKRDYVIHYIENTPLTLKHSYTFEDGTAQDQVGNAHGLVHGGEITKGIYSASEEGQYISFPGEEIAINTYPSITVEAYVKDDIITTNSKNTMVTYFGNSSGIGKDYYFTSLKSRAAISCKTNNPWSTETGVDGSDLLDDGLVHHIVSVLNYDSLSFYLDGSYVGSKKVSDLNKIYNIGNTFAYLCKSGYSGDKTWMGRVFEYNIYSGEMDASTVFSRSKTLPADDSTSDATLSDLQLDGVSVTDFASAVLQYNVPLPKGSTYVPTVSATTKYPDADAVVTQATQIPDTATIVVTAEDKTTTVTYNVIFDFEISTVATLSDLTVDGTTVQGFDSAVFSYDVYLPVGTTTIPTVVGVASDAYASITVVNADTIPGTTTIEVTAEDGVTVNNYLINFKFDVPTDATLSDLKVDGTTISGFSPSVITYIVKLPAGTTTVPTVEVITNDTTAKYVVIPAASLPGTTTVTVTAGDGTTKKTYLVSFEVNTSSVKPANESMVHVYPTVFTKNFKVESAEAINSITVLNIAGKVVYQQYGEIFEQIIAVPTEGMYLVKVDIGGSTKIYKVFRTN